MCCLALRDTLCLSGVDRYIFRVTAESWHYLQKIEAIFTHSMTVKGKLMINCDIFSCLNIPYSGPGPTKIVG